MDIFSNPYSIAPFILNVSITGTVVIVFVLLLRLFLKRSPKILSYALWSVVLFRLLCPVSFSSDLSVFTVLDAPVKPTNDAVSVMEYIPERIVHLEYPEVDLPVPVISGIINEKLPSGDYQLGADPLEGDSIVAFYCWLNGVAVMLSYVILSYAVLRLRLIGTVSLRDNIRLADRIASPFVFGLIRPKIYLPSSPAASEREYIILHEQFHIRRGDHIWRLLAFLALSLHWFNPFVWLAFVLSEKDMEMSCDEAVIGKLGDGIKADYARSLLTLSAGKRGLLRTPLAFGENAVTGRIKNLANMKKPAAWIVCMTVLLCLTAAFSLLANPKLYEEVIRVDSQYYIQYGEPVTELPDGSKELGLLYSVLHRSADRPEQDMQAANIDPKYAGCMLYRSGEDPGVIYLEDYDGFYLPFGFSEDLMFRKSGGVTYDPTTITLTEAVIGQEYITENCLYMTPFSSYLALDGDSGYSYLLKEDGIEFHHKQTGNIYFNEFLSEWTDFPWSDEEWHELFAYGGIRYPSYRYEEMRVMELEDRLWLMDMDGELWIVDISAHPDGTEYIWSIYSLIPVF